MAKACQGCVFRAHCWPGGRPPEPPLAQGPVPSSRGLGRAALRGHAGLLCDVTQIAPTLGGAGDAVNATEREQFEEFMTSRWPGLVRLAFGLPGDRWRRHRVAEQPAATAPEAAVADPTTSVDDRSVLLGALQQLPQRQPAVVVLRYWEDLTDAQTGALLGCSASTVRSQAARALAKLRASGALADAGPDGTAPRPKAGGIR